LLKFWQAAAAGDEKPSVPELVSMRLEGGRHCRHHDPLGAASPERGATEEIIAAAGGASMPIRRRASALIAGVTKFVTKIPAVP
jgi:hypothetical protein